MNPAYLAAAAAIGMGFAAQPAINAAAVRAFGSPVAAAALSVAITLLVCVVYVLVRAEVPAPAQLAGLPWWIVLGGLIGAFVVAGGAAIVPVTGAAVFFVCMIAGQLFGSVLVDHLGAFGVEARAVSPLRLAGVALALGGAVLVRIG